MGRLGVGVQTGSGVAANHWGQCAGTWLQSRGARLTPGPRRGAQVCSLGASLPGCAFSAPPTLLGQTLMGKACCDLFKNASRLYLPGSPPSWIARSFLPLPTFLNAT